MLRLLLMEPSASALAAGEDFTRGDARALYEGVRSAVASGPRDTAAVLDALDAPLRAQAELLLAWGADLPKTPTPSLAAEAAGCLRNLRLLNHHREIALIGLRLQELEDTGDRARVVEELGRVAALTAAIRRLEREGGPAPATN